MPSLENAIGSAFVPNAGRDSNTINAILENLRKRKEQERSEAERVGIIKALSGAPVFDPSAEGSVRFPTEQEIKSARTRLAMRNPAALNAINAMGKRNDAQEISNTKRELSEKIALINFVNKGKDYVGKLERINFVANHMKADGGSEDEIKQITDLRNLSEDELNKELLLGLDLATNSRAALSPSKQPTAQTKRAKVMQDFKNGLTSESQRDAQLKAIDEAEIRLAAQESREERGIALKETELALKEGAPTAPLTEVGKIKRDVEAGNITGEEGATLIKDLQIKRSKDEVREKFELVRNGNNEVIGQKSTLTGKVSSVPDSFLAADKKGVDIKKVNPEFFTGESVDNFKKTRNHSDLELRPLVLKKLKKDGAAKLGPSALTVKDGVVHANQMVIGPDGKPEIESLPLPGKVVGTQTGLTPQQASDLRVDTTGKKKQVVTEVERDEGFIDSAFTAADAVPPIRQSLKLLKTIQTGGIDAIELATKQKLGMESGDEAELAFNLRKNVLRQLKPTFGAAFTEREGKLLASIEASATKSTKGNIRLLRRALEVYNRSIDRGLRSAKRRGDQFAIDEINAAKKDLEALNDNDVLIGLGATPDITLNKSINSAPGRVGRFRVEVE